MAHFRTALITGASAGIGAAFARELASRGSDVVLVARRTEALEELAGNLARAHGVRTEVLTADLSGDAGIAAVEQRLADAERPVDLLVNNAGIGAGGRFADQPTEVLERVTTINVLAVVRLAHAAMAAMTGRGGGGIVNLGSVAGMVPSAPGNAIYSASKAFVNSFGASLAAEGRGSGVRVTTVCPGYVRTDMTTGLQERGMPGIAWVPVERVVADALTGLAARRPLVVSGPQYKAADVALRFAPRNLTTTVMSRFSTAPD